jgi:hypothetical protein
MKVVWATPKIALCYKNFHPRLLFLVEFTTTATRLTQGRRKSIKPHGGAFVSR